MPYEYDARVVRVIDGDTVVLELTKESTFEVDFGFYIIDKIVKKSSTTMSFRLIGIDTPEVVGETKEKGLASKAEIVRLLALGSVRATTYKPDKYGRWLVTLIVTKPDGTLLNVNEELVRTGHAVSYMV